MILVYTCCVFKAYLGEFVYVVYWVNWVYWVYWVYVVYWVYWVYWVYCHRPLLYHTM